MEKKFEEFIRKTREKYTETGPMPCPAFGNELIYFKKSYFKHLLRKRGILRSESEQKRKLILFKYALEIIKSTKVIDEYRKGKKINDPEAGQFWALSKIYGNRKVSVIIRQIGSNQKHFFSVKDEETRN